jgi:tetrathionate reductase subunit C
VDLKIFYNIHYEMPLGIPIALYFYLTGLSAGSFVISVISTLGGRTEYKPIGRIGAVLAPVLLILAPLMLIIDLEQPPRFWHLFLYLNLKSPITYGSFLLTLYPINGLIYAWFLFKGNTRRAKILGLIGIPLAIATHGYTGFILALGKGRILWSTALMPTLFIISAMVSGMALVIIAAAIRYTYRYAHTPEGEREKDRTLILNLGKMMGGIIIADLFLVGNDILVLLTSTQEALHVAHLILFGKFQPFFVGIEILLGGFLPMFLVFFPWTGRSLRGVVAASVLVMIGVMAMRYVVVVAGQFLPLH